MPCFERTTVTLSMAKADLNVLRETLAAVYYTSLPYAAMDNHLKSVVNAWADDVRAGRFSIDEETADRIRRTYSGRLIAKNARKFGWSVKQTGTAKFELRRRA